MPAREDSVVKIAIDVTEDEITINKGPLFVEIAPLYFGLDENGDAALWVQKTKHAARLENPIVRLIVKPTVDGIIDRSKDRHYFGTAILATGAVHLFGELKH